MSGFPPPADGTTLEPGPGDGGDPTEKERSAPLVPFHFAQRQGVLALPDGGAGPLPVIHRPEATLGALLELRRHVGRPIRLEAVSRERFDGALAGAFQQDSQRDLEELDGLSLERASQSLAEAKDLVDSADDRLVVRFVRALLAKAVQLSASDIHVEPYEGQLVVRFRVDGVLHRDSHHHPALGPLVVSRIKVQGGLDIAEKRMPQDGRFSFKLAGRPLDVRVSTIPTSGGERVVLRILDKGDATFTLEQLGMDPAVRTALEGAIAKPHGMILVTGPTGSGKTTTLYAVLQRLNQVQRNIMTVEDPVEYSLAGISQTDVNSKVELTFARGLRAILRQDPDVVMVGEIRDLETARIAVQASMTGHLVLSTLHTNSAIGAVTRLRDMGVEPFLLSSSLLAVMGQRLVRRLCRHCREPVTLSPGELERVGLPVPAGVRGWRGVGCPHCNDSGYRGRSGLTEYLGIDATLRQLIHDGAGEAALRQGAGPAFRTLRHDGLRLAVAGVTSLEEVLRVTRQV